MATQALSHKSLPKTGFKSETGSNWQTMTSGSGNGSVAAFANAKLLVLWNDTVSSVNFTIKAAQDGKHSARSMSVGDMVVAVAAAGIAIVPISSAFNSSGNITVECSGTAKVAVLSYWSED